MFVSNRIYLPNLFVLTYNKYMVTYITLLSNLINHHNHVMVLIVTSVNRFL